MSLSEREKIFDLGGKRKKVLATLSIFALKNWLCSVSTKIAFQPSQGFIQMNWGQRRDVTVRVESEMEKNFDLSALRKNYSIRCQFSRSNTRCMVFQIAFQPIQGLIQKN